MTGLLLKATDIAKLPVVGIDSGDALAEVKDVVYSPEHGRVLGFTLNKRGFLRGPMRSVLPFEEAAVGRDAVMVRSAAALEHKRKDLSDDGSKGGVNVLGNEVLTDAGRRLGEVIDVVVEVRSGEVVGYELQGDPDLQAHAGAPLLIPIPDTLAVSGSELMVPASAEPYIRDDLSGFGAAVTDFRAQLRQGR
ncbi:MAG: PRC-barrel domain-containing protein [Actinomycetota bacterium]|nr:PRC-barrel domain-containing protein [Actinomycetota bacterium]